MDEQDMNSVTQQNFPKYGNILDSVIVGILREIVKYCFYGGKTSM